MSGHWNASKYGGSLRTLVDDFRSKGSQESEAYIEKLHRLGVLGQGVRANEVLRDLDDIGLDTEYAKAGHVSGALGAFKRAIRVPAKLYQTSDHLGKIYGFQNELARTKRIHPTWGLERAERYAAERVLNTYPTYSKIPPAIQKLRRQPLVGPFVSFWWETLRTTGNSILYTAEDLSEGYRSGNRAQMRAGAERAAGQLAALSLPLAAQEITKALLGISDEDEEDFRLFVAPWERGSVFMFLGRENGNTRYVDLSSFSPYSALTDPLNRVFGGDGAVLDRMTEAVAEFFQPLVGEAIFTGALLDVARNKTKTGARVYNPEDSVQGQWEDRLTHMFEALEPGTLDRMRNRIIPGIRGEETSYGDKIRPVDEITAEVTGVKVRSLDYGTGLTFQARDFKESEGDIRRLFLRELYRPGSPRDKILEAYQEMEQRRFTRWVDMHRRVAAAGRAGVGRAEILEALEGANLSQADSAALLRGVYVPLDIGGQTVAGAARQRGRDEVPLREMADVFKRYARRPLSE
jgi:hypothetical protein